MSQLFLISSLTNTIQTYRQWLTTHSLLQYSSSHSAFEIAGFGHPWRMQEFGGRIAPWPTFCCAELGGTWGVAGPAEETGGELDTIGGGLTCCMCWGCWATCCWEGTYYDFIYSQITKPHRFQIVLQKSIIIHFAKFINRANVQGLPVAYSYYYVVVVCVVAYSCDLARVPSATATCPDVAGHSYCS